MNDSGEQTSHHLRAFAGLFLRVAVSPCQKASPTALHASAEPRMQASWFSRGPSESTSASKPPFSRSSHAAGTTINARTRAPNARRRHEDRPAALLCVPARLDSPGPQATFLPRSCRSLERYAASRGCSHHVVLSASLTYTGEPERGACGPGPERLSPRTYMRSPRPSEGQGGAPWSTYRGGLGARASQAGVARRALPRQATSAPAPLLG